MLTQLKNGDWADLADVTMVEVCDIYQYRDRGVMVVLPPRVAATFRTGYIKMINCESIEEARAYRDELAVMVNTAKAESLKPTSPVKSWHDEKPLI